MTQDEAIAYWKESAGDNKQAARDNTDKHPEWAFFLWHLAIEKTLKGLLIKKGEVPPPIHDLVKLVERLGIPVNDVQRSYLGEIASYAIEARYDDYKRKYYKKVTQNEYQKIWFARCEEIYTWLNKQF